MTMWTTANALIGAASGLAGSLAVVAPFVAGQRKRAKVLVQFTDSRLSSFLDDWFGEPARPGFPRRPGVPERLEIVEQKLEAIERLVPERDEP